MPARNTTPVLKTASPAATLKTLAGSPHSRRGSVLVLVVGVLALLAIVVVVYTSVGQADARGGRAMVNQARLSDQSAAMADYIAGLVGADATAVRTQRVYIDGGTPSYYTTLEGIDYPYTDPALRADITRPGITSPEFRRFDPVGSITRAWNGTGEDPRVPSDSWLSSSEPTWINRDGTSLPAIPDPRNLLGLQRDWGHLPIITPGGLPVNLANLRGNFDARPGFSNNPYAANITPAISDNLYLMGRSGGNADAGFSATPVQDVQVTDLDKYNTPATWANNRLETFRPIVWNPSSLASSDVKLLGNMMGDADGDGWFDALWQELVDSSDPSAPNTLLQGGGGVRWFIAPRIIDLSGMVNINTASSFAVPPNIENPAGITPADIDLERILTTADARQYFGVNYDDIYNGPGSPFAGASNAQIMAAGRSAMAGLFQARLTGLTEVTLTPATPLEYGPEVISPEWARQLGTAFPTGVTATNGGTLMGAVTRKELYTYGGKEEIAGRLRTDSGVTNPTPTSYYLKQPTGFGMGDERDLRARGFTNDDTTTSRAEAVSSANIDSTIARLNPLRPTRDGLTDREAGLVEYVGTGNNAFPRSLAQFGLDPRRHLTTISGARPLGTFPIRLTGINDSGARTIGAADVKLDVTSLLERASWLPSGSGTVQQFSLPAANEIFRGYARSLAPFLGDPAAWNSVNTTKRALALAYGGLDYTTTTDPFDTQYGETNTTQSFSGRPAEVALRMAAHMTLNLLAWQDDFRTGTINPTENRPIGATLLLDDTRRNELTTEVWTGSLRKFPYWDRTTGANRLAVNNATRTDNNFGTTSISPKAFTFDMNMGVATGGTNPQGYLAGGGTNTYTTGYALNMFAAQPQPFITAAVSFSMYYDAPIANGGDGQGQEWEITNPGDPGMNIPPTVSSLGMTIDGTASITNPDYIMECVAFQLTNPFDAPLRLPPGGYYIEFGDRTYLISGNSNPNAGIDTAAEVTLAPRESRCFYVLSQDPTPAWTRWFNADGRVNGLAAGGQNGVARWVERQLRLAGVATTNTPLRMASYNPTTNVATIGGFNDIFSSNDSTDPDFKTVRLWRRVVETTGGETPTNNSLLNDYLVDRLRDPNIDNNSPAALFRRLPDSLQQFTNVATGPEPSEEPYYTVYQNAQGPGRNANDSLGHAMLFFGEVRRRTDPSGGPLPVTATSPDTFAGVMPSWCMEPKIGGTFTSSITSRNVTASTPGITDYDDAITAYNNGTFSTNGVHAADSFFALARNGVNNAAGTSATVHPASRNQANDTAANLIGNDLASVNWIDGHKATQFPVYPRRAGNLANNEFERPPLRPADLLLPWAVGPWQDPTNTDPDFRHTTLSEAMAFGLNYASSSDASSFESRLGASLDRCRLKLDRFVAFNDVNADGQWNYTQTPDPLLSTGVPLALNILDTFRTTRYGAQDSAAMGRINLNTATLAALKALPFVTPVSPNINDGDGDAFGTSWVSTVNGQIDLSLRNDSGNVAADPLWRANRDRWDAAATLAAYRDRNAVVARGPNGGETARRTYVDFAPTNDGIDPANNDHRGGRRFMNNVVNLREEPGFRTPGELLMAITQDNSTRGVPALTADELAELGTQRFNNRLFTGGTQTAPTNHATLVESINTPQAVNRTAAEVQRTQALGLTAMASMRPATAPANGQVFVQGGTSADYDRKLAIANALLNCVTTTSDYYCAYFLVNGYTQADVQGLEPWTGNGAPPAEDRYTRPMTPSIQRRFMMVLDRSQCVRPGDKPKVLMFQELPVR